MIFMEDKTKDVIMRQYDPQQHMPRTSLMMILIRMILHWQQSVKTIFLGFAVFCKNAVLFPVSNKQETQFPENAENARLMAERL